MRANKSGSFWAIHSSLGAVKPAKAMLAVWRLSASRPTWWLSQSTWGAVRPSFHKMAGRSTCPWSSRATRPCIWPPTPMPATWAGSTPSSS